MRPRTEVDLLRKEKTFTKWLRPTRRLLTLSGNKIFAQAVSDGMYAAVDSLVDKLDRQIVKHKEKLKDHHQREVEHHVIH